MTAHHLDPAGQLAISDVLVRYATAIDRRDFTALRSCFTDDCDADYGEIGHWHGAAEIAAWMEAAHRELGPTMHRLTNIAIDTSASPPTARSYVDAVLVHPGRQSYARALGFYDDELTSDGTSWQIARRRFTMIVYQPDSPIDTPSN